MARNYPILTAARRKLLRLRRSGWLQKLAIYVPLSLLGFIIFLIALYSIVNPPVTTLTIARHILLRPVHQTWLPLDKISKQLPRAVIMSEDAKFCYHWGVDWGAVEQVWEDLEDGEAPRGASTISMQTVKNLFLWHSRSYIRKVLEVPLAYVSSLFWSKRRMMEIYLNIAEWGPGIFGAEAAARHHFNKSASQLTRHEAALLAAALPNPFIRRAGRPGPKTRRMANRIEKRMAAAGRWVKCLQK